MIHVNLAKCAKSLVNASYKKYFCSPRVVPVHIFAPIFSVFKFCKFRRGFASFETKCSPEYFVRPVLCERPQSVQSFPSKSLFMWAFSFPFLGFLFKEEEEKEDEVITMMKRAILASRRGEDAKAEQLLHLALKAAQEKDDQDAITYIYDLMANFALKKEEYKKAEKLFTSVLKRLLIKGMSDEDNAIVEISLKLSSIYSHLEDYEKAAQGFQFCIGTQEKKLQTQGEENVDENTLVLWAMSHDWYARFLLHLAHYDEAKNHFLRAYNVCVKVKGWEDPQTAVLLNDLGSVCSLQQKYDEAIQYMQEAIRVGKLCESEDLASFYVNLGTIYMQKKVFDKADEYCQKGKTIAEDSKNEEAANESLICLNTLKELQNS